ncbi:hypothetical protein LJR029_006336 [Caballeronia sp. LjRoot29]|uniref:hypothetical protein n=1 Tax=Caballeronia sp. LjRoot29 TaxID=3342315 RepID=UPI003ECDFC99
MNRLNNILLLTGCAALVQIAAKSVSAEVTPESGKVHISELKKIAGNSLCAAKNWTDRGPAKRSYIEGVALVFARSACQPNRPDVKVVSRAVDVANQRTDALAVYDPRFRQLGMDNSVSGIDTLRHSYVLLLGLGMRESSGKYCEGRDVSQCFDKAESAEAGLFQTSYGARKADPTLEGLIRLYSGNRTGCMLTEFKDNLSCRIRASSNPACPNATSDVIGSGPGADWQRLTKSCPAFATEYAAVVLRTSGGNKGEFNPIRKGQAELEPALAGPHPEDKKNSDCDTMLKGIQNYVREKPDACVALEQPLD